MNPLLHMRLKYDVINLHGLVIIPAHTELNLEHLELLEKHDIDPLSIVVQANAEERIEEISQIIANSAVQLRNLFDSINENGKVPLMEIRTQIMPNIGQLTLCTDFFYLMNQVKAKDEYTYQHNIGVSVLSTMIGKWLNLSEDELSILTLAALLHDVGKVRIADDILLKPAKLTAEEYHQIKMHTVHGYDILKNSHDLDPRIPLVAMQHHEREDGTGYPLGIKAEKLNYFSKIVAVADIFHAMSSRRPYHNPAPFHKVVKKMKEGEFGELDPYIVTIFLENMFEKMIGKEIILTDGRKGEVVFIHPNDLLSPLVRIENEFLDLSTDKSVFIQEIIDDFKG
jgi:HD-GYP domain-containing protein (c-di-GMP phosphodiesterase class II)